MKKVGRIPDGGGWRAHGNGNGNGNGRGRGRSADRAARRTKTKGAKAGYVYLHSAIDGFSRLAYTEPLDKETATTAIGLFVRAFFQAHGIGPITRVIIDNGSCSRAAAFTPFPVRRIPPSAHPSAHLHAQRARSSVISGSWPRSCSTPVPGPHTQRAAALSVWTVHYNYHRPHTAAGNRPPASRLHAGVINVMTRNN